MVLVMLVFERVCDFLGGCVLGEVCDILYGSVLGLSP